MTHDIAAGTTHTSIRMGHGQSGRQNKKRNKALLKGSHIVVRFFDNVPAGCCVCVNVGFSVGFSGDGETTAVSSGFFPPERGSVFSVQIPLVCLDESDNYLFITTMATGVSTENGSIGVIDLMSGAGVPSYV
jgi:hypothetical protein